MRGYATISKALLDHFIGSSSLSEFITESRASVGDVDAVLDAIFSEGANYGLWFEFGGGVIDSSSPFKVPTWKWTFAGVFMIRYGEDIETRLAQVLQHLPDVFAHDPRLGGASPLAKLTAINPPEQMRVNDIDFYWLPFLVEVYDH